MILIDMFSDGISSGGCVMASFENTRDPDVIGCQMVCLNVSA